MTLYFNPLTTRLLTLSGIMALSLSLSGCGGGDGNTADALLPEALKDGQSGLFLGHIVGTAADAPNPNPQGLYINVPSGSTGNVTGQASFKYQPCQATNTLDIFGKKSISQVLATMNGTLEKASINQADITILTNFNGGYRSTDTSWGGSYLFQVGNTSKDFWANDCSPPYHYTVSSKGEWRAYPVGTKIPANFLVRNAGSNVISWQNAPATSASMLLSVLNPTAVGGTQQNAFVYQTMISNLQAANTSQVLPNTVILPNTPYLVLVQLFDSAHHLVAIDSETMTF